MVLCLWSFSGTGSENCRGFECARFEMLQGFVESVVIGGFCFASDLLIDNIHLEDSCFVVREHSTVKEILRQSQVYHPIMVCDDRVDGAVHQCFVLIRQVKKHPLETQHSHCYFH